MSLGVLRRRNCFVLLIYFPEKHRPETNTIKGTSNERNSKRVFGSPSLLCAITIRKMPMKRMKSIERSRWDLIAEFCILSDSCWIYFFLLTFTPFLLNFHTGISCQSMWPTKASRIKVLSVRRVHRGHCVGMRVITK